MGGSLMRRYLLIAHQTVGGNNLRRCVHRRRARGPCHFHVVVPAPGPVTLWGSIIDALEGATPGDPDSVDEGARRLAFELAWLDRLGVEAEGEIGDPDPITAIESALRHGEYDEILVSTPPAGPSSWVHADLPHRIPHHIHRPVTVVVDRPSRRGYSKTTVRPA